MSGADERAAADYAFCEGLVRREDPDRWLASLFVPNPARRSIHALLAFGIEIARVRESVSEPLLGEIRFQWWRDALETPDRGAVVAHPVAAALLDTIEWHRLPTAPLVELIDARTFDLYDEPIESVEGLETYARATSSSLFQLSCDILDFEASAGDLGAADHAGTAYAVTGLLRALPWHRLRGQMFVPLELLGKHGATRADYVAGRPTSGVIAALTDLRALARSHLDVFSARLPGIPGPGRAAFLPVALCESYLRLMDKEGYDPFETRIELPQWRRQWILWRAARRWR